jgi:hypothetical protein
VPFVRLSPTSRERVRGFAPKGQQRRRSAEKAAAPKCNAQGRFAINTFAGDSLGITAYAPEGELYLDPIKHLEWPKGAVQQEIEIALPRGILVRGTVREKASGKDVS